MVQPLSGKNAAPSAGLAGLADPADFAGAPALCLGLTAADLFFGAAGFNACRTLSRVAFKPRRANAAMLRSKKRAQLAVRSRFAMRAILQPGLRALCAPRPRRQLRQLRAARPQPRTSSSWMSPVSAPARGSGAAMALAELEPSSAWNSIPPAIPPATPPAIPLDDGSAPIAA